MWKSEGHAERLEASDTQLPVPDVQPWEVEITAEGQGDGVDTPHERNQAEASEPRSGDELPQADTRRRGDGTSIALWAAAGAVGGFGASWTMGGEALTWMAAGAALGASSGWVSLRWPSRK
jgi:hypothetical protein